ncbi:MAG: hypothetical protein IJE04_05015 [Bacilli bacterium]|nr:hypothetical protein [Bacilli bacterium]
MKVNFEYTKEEYKKFLLKGRLLSNIVLFVIGLGIYLYFTLNKISLLYLPLFIVGLLVVIFLLNKLYIFAQLKVNEMLNYNTFGKYTLELTSNKFSITINKNKTDYKYSQVKRIKERKNCFEIKFKKGRDYLTFEKKFFTEEEYTKAIKMFKEKIN